MIPEVNLMLLGKPLENLGALRGIMYDFEKSGDVLLKHNHIESDVAGRSGRFRDPNLESVLHLDGITRHDGILEQVDNIARSRWSGSVSETSSDLSVLHKRVEVVL